MTSSCTPAVAAATAFAAVVLALDVCAAPAQAAAPTTASTSAVARFAAPPAHGVVVRNRVGVNNVDNAGAAVRSRDGENAGGGAAAASSSSDAGARSRLWHQTLAEFGILAAAFAALARRSFRPLTARRTRSRATAAPGEAEC